MDIPQFAYSLVDVHLYCFQFGVLQIKLVYKDKQMLLFSLDKYTSVKRLDRMVDIWMYGQLLTLKERKALSCDLDLKQPTALLHKSSNMRFLTAGFYNFLLPPSGKHKEASCPHTLSALFLCSLQLSPPHLPTVAAQARTI